MNPRPKQPDKKYLSVPTEYRHDTMTDIQVRSRKKYDKGTDVWYIIKPVIGLIWLIVG